MKITDYEKVTSLLPQNVLLTDGEGGTKTILARDLLPALLAITNARDSLGTIDVTQLAQITGIKPTDRLIVSQDGTNKGITIEDLYWSMLDEIITWPERRNVYRGKNLGSVFTEEQKKNINGKFKGFFVGDYWEIGGNFWRIADINYWKDKGQQLVPPSHILIVPDRNVLGSTLVPMNDTRTTEGGYMNSKMRKDTDGGLNQAETIIYAAFGESNIVTRSEFFTNAATDGTATGSIWVNSKIDLMTEEMVYGSSEGNTSGMTVIAERKTDVTQLSIFRHNPSCMLCYASNNRTTYWLRDIANRNCFCAYSHAGAPSPAEAQELHAVRPVFGLKGE